MKRTLSIILLLPVFVQCYAQPDTTNLRNWKTYAVPTEDSVTKYNHSAHDWIVYLQDDEVHAGLLGKEPVAKELPFEINRGDGLDAMRMRGKRSVAKVNDGYLVAFWRGEFGGHLYWFSHDGTSRKHVKLTRILQFIERDNNLYAINGLAHLGFSIGNVIQLKKADSGWTTSEYKALSFAPYATALDANDNMIVVTSGDLVSIDKNGTLTTLIKNGFWDNLYPTSMVIYKNACYIGMRKGILKFDMATKKQEWLLPQ